MSQPLFQGFYVPNLIPQQTWEVAMIIPVFKMRSKDMVTLISLTEIVGLVLNPQCSVPSFLPGYFFSLQWNGWAWSHHPFPFQYTSAPPCGNSSKIVKDYNLKRQKWGPESIDSEIARTPCSLLPQPSPRSMGLGVLVNKMQEAAPVLLILLCSVLLMGRETPIRTMDSGTVELSYLI